MARLDLAFGCLVISASQEHPEVSPFGSGYIARLPGAEHLAARCNPVTAPAGAAPSGSIQRIGDR